MKRPPDRVIEPEPPERSSRSSGQTTSADTSVPSSSNAAAAAAAGRRRRRLGIPSKSNLLWLIGFLLVTAPQPASAIPVPSSTSTILYADQSSLSSSSSSSSLPLSLLPLPPTPTAASLPSVSFLSLPNRRLSAGANGKARSIFGSPSPALSDDGCDQEIDCSPLSPFLPSSPSSSSATSSSSPQMAVQNQLINHSSRLQAHASAQQRRVVDQYLSDDYGIWYLNSEWELYGISPLNAAVSSVPSSSTTTVPSATSTSVSSNTSTPTPTTLPPGWGKSSRSEFELPLIVACSVALALVVLVTMFIFIRRRNKHRKKHKKRRSKRKTDDMTHATHSKPASITSSVASARSQPTKERPKDKKSLVGILRPKGTKGFLRMRRRRKSASLNEDDEDGTEDQDGPKWASRTRPDGSSGDGSGDEVAADGEEDPTDRAPISNEAVRSSRVASYSSLDPLSSASNSASLTDPPTTTTTPTSTTMSSTGETSTSAEPATNITGEPTPAVYHEIVPPSTSLVDSNRQLSIPEIPDSHQPTPPAYRASQVTSTAHQRHLASSSLSQLSADPEHPPMPYASSQAQHPRSSHHPAPPFTPDSSSTARDPSGRSSSTIVPMMGAQGAIIPTTEPVPGQLPAAVIDASDYPRDEKFRPARPVTPPLSSSSTFHNNIQFSGRSTEPGGEMTTTTNRAHHLATDDKGVLARLANQASAPVDLHETSLTGENQPDHLEGTAPPGWELENPPSTMATSPSAPFPSSSISHSLSSYPQAGRPDLLEPHDIPAGMGERTNVLPAPPRQWGTKTMEDPYIPLDASGVSLGPPDDPMDFADEEEGGGTDCVHGMPSAPFDPHSELKEERGHFGGDSVVEAPSAPPLEDEEVEEGEPEQRRRRESFEASAPDLHALEEEASAPCLESEARDGDH